MINYYVDIDIIFNNDYDITILVINDLVMINNDKIISSYRLEL